MHFLLALLALPLISQASPASSLTTRFRRDVDVNPLSDGVTTLDGVNIADIPQRLSTAEIVSAAISRNGWNVTCDSFQPGNECNKTIDGNANTFWHTEYNPVNSSLPHWIMIDMQASYPVGNVTIEPRQDGSPNGHIGQHTIALSEDGKTWGAPVAVGSYIDDASLKATTFTPANARYVKITALSEAGNRGPWTSITEVNVYTGGTPAPAPAPATFGSWGLTIDFPLVPVSASMEVASGRLLVWSSWIPSDFHGTNGQTTITASYDLVTQLVSEAVITNVGHDMFCEGLSIDFSGKIVAVGGNSDYATSLYDSVSNSWTRGGNLNIARGYQAQSTLSDGRTFTIGASWSGPHGGKNGEIYDPTTNEWTELNGCLVQPMLTQDAQDKELGYLYRGDNHAWLFSWKNGSVLQAGPSSAMNWYGTAGNGTQTPAGTRANDPDSMCGNAVMYEAVAGNILTLGGSPDYTGSYATANAHIINISKSNTNPVVTTINPMTYPRGFANSVILPDGQVLVVGGQSFAVPFTDVTAQYTPELWNPKTKKFTPMAPISIPRTYHSTAILLPDGTVMSGGGGLCGSSCATNHWDAQIFSPPYLFNSTDDTPAQRPSILSPAGTTTVPNGGTFTITTSGPVKTIAMVRVGSTTHTVNTDQRRMVLAYSHKQGTLSYSATVPANPGVAVPGFWMLFVLTGDGVPSVATFVQITPAG